MERERIIEALKICDSNYDGVVCKECPIRDENYNGSRYDKDGDCYQHLMREAAELLSEQSAIQPVATDTNVGDTISRQAAVELAMKYCPDDDGAVQCDGDIRELLDELENLPPAQPEHDAEFWRKRAEEYSNICLAMTAEMTKGIKFNSIRIDENGICFGKEQPEQKWIPCSERLPDDLAEVNVTWVNHDPEPYYGFTKDKPFTASAVYYEGKWYWYSSTCADFLGEYGRNDVDAVDDAIEITAWQPFPEPYKEAEKHGTD